MQEGLLIPAHDVAPLEHIASGVFGLRILMVNVYAVRHPDRSWTLLDAGLPFSAAKIRHWAGRLFGEDSRPNAIVLTHAHFDHVGALKSLAEYWEVPVYAHPLEMPYLTGRSKYPPPDPTVGGGALALMAPLYPRGPVNITGRVFGLPADGAVPGMPGWRWIFTPGHTAGHVSFFREDDRVLIGGDAFVTTKQESLLAVATQKPELHGPPSYYTQDWEAAKLSVGRLSALLPAVAACGHGLPMAGPELADSLQQLAERFDEVARPWHGRYSRTPAVTDERGIVSVPAAKGRGAGKVLIGAAIAGAALYGITRWRRAA